MHDANKSSVFKRLFSSKRTACSVVLIFFGLCTAIITACFSMIFPGSKPVLTFFPDVPLQKVVGMMDAVCRGDFTEAASYALDNPDLGIDRQAANEVGTIIWDAFIESTTYSLSGDCYTTDDGLAQNITFTCLDMTSITGRLRERSQALLKQRVEEAEDVSEIYDENNEYRDDVVNDVLKEAVVAALAEDTSTITTTVAVDLKYVNGQWWVVDAVTTVSKESSLYLDGINFTYHKNRLPFNRVTALSTVSGAEIVSNQLYHVISTEDIFALFHYISYRSIGIMSIYPKNAAGSLLSDYQEVVLTETGTPFTVQSAITLAENAPATADNTLSVVTMQRGFNLIDLIKEPNRITICVCALFIAFFALLWYIVPRMNRIRVWFRIYRIRSKKRSTHTLYGLKKRF